MHSQRPTALRALCGYATAPQHAYIFCNVCADVCLRLLLALVMP